MRPWPKVAMVVGSVAVAAQFAQFARTNPPVTGDLAAPEPIKGVLREACYDCHSNETGWPWYSCVAPFSWLIHHEVTEGRRRLNFSQWAEYASDPGTLSQKLAQISQAVANGEMAPWYYRLLHPQARLAPAQRAALVKWVGEESARSPASP